MTANTSARALRVAADTAWPTVLESRGRDVGIVCGKGAQRWPIQDRSRIAQSRRSSTQAERRQDPKWSAVLAAGLSAGAPTGSTSWVYSGQLCEEPRSGQDRVSARSWQLQLPTSRRRFPLCKTKNQEDRTLPGRQACLSAGFFICRQTFATCDSATWVTGQGVVGGASGH
jgi:hypothetical protein